MSYYSLISIMPKGSVVPTVSDTDAQAFLNAAIITDVTQANAVNTLVIGLKADLIWTKLTAIYPFVGGTATTHKYNLKDPRDLNDAYRLTFSGGWVHNSSGIIGNGLNTLANTYYSGPVSTIGAYNKAGGGVISLGYAQDEVYCYDDEGYVRCDLIAPGPKIILNTEYAQYGFGSGTSGFYKDGLGQVGTAGYKNGIKLADSLGSGPITLLDTIVVGALRFIYTEGGSIFLNQISGYTAATQSFNYFSSASLNDVESANLYTRIQTFQTALGRQIDTLNVDPDAFVFLNNAKINDPINSTTQINAVNNLVIGLKSQSLWGKMADIYPIVTDTRNLVSTNFDNNDADAWVRGSNTVFYGKVFAPDGTRTAENGQFGANVSLRQSIIVNVSQSYVFSVYLISSSPQSMRIAIGGNITNCNVTPEWQRFVVTGSLLTGGAQATISNPSGSTISQIAVWGPQVEIGSIPTPFQEIGYRKSSRANDQFTHNLKTSPRKMAFINVTDGWTLSSNGAKANGMGWASTSFSFDVNSYLTASNVHISAYSRTAITPSGNRTLFGGIFGSNASAYNTFTSTPFNANIAMGGIASASAAFINTQGLIVVSATGYSAGQLKAYQNGVIRGSGTLNNPALLPKIIGFNALITDFLSPSNLSPFELAFISLGSGLTDSESTAFNTIVNTYQTALSRNV